VGRPVRRGNSGGGRHADRLVIPDVSVVIPTRNGMATLPTLVRALEQQDDEAPRELIVVDSGSTDGTREYAERVATRLIVITPEQFDHGATRNVGVSASRGRYVVLTVQDARPTHREWLRRLLAPLRADLAVAGAFARQVPRPDSSAVVRAQLAGWVASQSTPRTVTATRDELDTLSPHARLDRCAFDHVCAAVRRDVWATLPYESTPIAEDLIWARAALLAGHALTFVPEAVVEHSHERSAGYEFARTWALHQQLLRLFGLRTVPSLAALGRAIATTTRHHHRLTRSHGAAIGSDAWRRAMALAVAWPAGQFVGGWTQASGRSHWRPRGV
jgi:rhamnosyltransferase